MKSKGLKRLRVAFIVVFLLVIGGTVLCLCLTSKKAAPGTGVACPPVRTALAALALVENPTARTYVALGPGAGTFANVFAHAGLAAVTNPAECADLVFVSGETSWTALARAQARCATNGLLAVHYDVRRKTFGKFRRELAALPAGAWRLWFPGRSDCLVTVDANGFRVYGRPRLSDMLDLFSREGLFSDFSRAGIDSLPALLASYVGTRETVEPVFGFAQGEVVPECFVTKDVPPMDWIDCTGVDADISKGILDEVRAKQFVRRLVLKGDIFSREGRMDAAMKKWTKAVACHPNDSLILERICQLDVNAEAFMKVGNFPMAAQCLETMVCLRTNDVVTARKLVRVLRQMGKKADADALAKRADEIARAKLSVDAVSRPRQTRETEK